MGGVTYIGGWCHNIGDVIDWYFGVNDKLPLHAPPSLTQNC